MAGGYGPKGELISNWSQFVNKADKDLPALIRGCYWKGKLTNLAQAQHEKEYVMKETQSLSTLLQRAVSEETDRFSDPKLFKGKFPPERASGSERPERRTEMVTPNPPMSKDLEKVEHRRRIHHSTEKHFSLAKEREALEKESEDTKAVSSTEIIPFPSRYARKGKPRFMILRPTMRSAVLLTSRRYRSIIRQRLLSCQRRELI